MSAGDIDPEKFVREGGDCICGSMYSYAGIIEPGQFSPECPVHWMPPLEQGEDEDYPGEYIGRNRGGS